MIGRNGERGSGISALAARHDDDDITSKGNFKRLWSFGLMAHQTLLVI